MKGGGGGGGGTARKMFCVLRFAFGVLRLDIFTLWPSVAPGRDPCKTLMSEMNWNLALLYGTFPLKHEWADKRGKCWSGQTPLRPHLLQLFNCFILTRKTFATGCSAISYLIYRHKNDHNHTSLPHVFASETCGGADRPIFISSHCKPPPSDLLAPRELCLNIISCGMWTKPISLPHRVPTYVQTESCKDPQSHGGCQSACKIRSFVPRLGSLGNK